MSFRVLIPLTVLGGGGLLGCDLGDLDLSVLDLPAEGRACCGASIDHNFCKKGDFNIMNL